MQDKGSSSVPENLLAVAKDERYLQECQRYLAQIASEWFGSTSTSGNDWEELTELVSALLYAGLVLRRKKRTLGMEVCGVEYAAPANVSRWKPVVASIAAAVWVYGVRNLAKDSEAPANERLRGSERRRIFEEQRRAMLQRATLGPIKSAVDSARSTTIPDAQQSMSRLETLQRWVKHVAKAMVIPIGSSSEGPHRVHNTTGQQLQRHTRYTVGMWILRLHLSWFCLDGKFPTLVDRVFRLNRGSAPSTTESALVHRPESARVVGLLILAHALGTSWNAMSRRAVRWWVDTTVSEAPQSSPCIVFEGAPATLVDTDAICSICHKNRQYPACSTNCGHIFCWHCLHQWVSLNAAACPLCRKPCAANEIVLLRNFRGS
jgi:Ring finger domain